MRALCTVLLLALIPASTQAQPADLVDRVGVMLQVDNLLDAYRQQGRGKDFTREVDEQFRLTAEAGARWARAGILWNQIEAKPGVYDWGPVESVLRAANRHRVRLVWLVGGTPLWNSRGDAEDPPKQVPDPHIAKFLGQLVQRYGGTKDATQPLRGSIQYWEIINEPNYRWPAAEYATVLVQARAVLQADPAARIVLGGLGGDILGNSPDVKEGNQVRYFDKVMRSLPPGVRPFDVTNFHIYGNDADRFFAGDDAVAKYFARCQGDVRAVLLKHKLAELPFWCTEFDYPSALEHQVIGPYKGTSAADGLVKQARFLTDWLPRIWSDEPQCKVFWASLVDDANDGGAFLSTGLCHWRSKADQHGVGERKLAWYALRDLLR
jgi:hypothetical protein